MGTFQDTYKITAADKVGKGNVGLPDTPGLTTRGMQEQLDSLSNLSIDKFNTMVDAVKETLNDSDTELPTSGAVINYISGEGGAIIDDTTPSLHKAYSSQKVENMFSEVASRVIDDETPSADKTYSSAEIEEKLSDIPSPESIIDDDTASTDTTYSSSKLESDFISVSDTEEQTATDEFTTINGGLLSSLKVALSPNQDLHGYDSPWVGGESKNIIPMTVDAIKTLNSAMPWVDKVATVNGVTFTILTDNADNIIGFDVDGTASLRIDLHLGEYTANGGNYTISGSTDGSYTTWAVWSRFHGMIESQMSLDGAGTFYDVSGEVLMTELTIFQGTTLNHQKFYPMLCLSSAPEPTVFAPYSNICPIDGHTQVDVDVSDGQATQEQVTVNLGGTYYSGILDVVSGVLMVAKVGKDMTTITDWNVNIANQRIYKILSDIKPTSGSTIIPNIISNRFKAISINDIYAYVQGVAVSTGSALQFHIKGLTDRNDVTLAEVNQWFVDNPTLVVYELATPTPIQLSPTMVKALVGENHLSAPLDGQEITESVYSPLAKWNAVIDDTTASDDTTYSSNKINSIVPQIDDSATSATKVFSSLKTAALITELSERFDFSTTEKPIGWWTDGKVYYGKVIHINGCPKEMFGLMVDLGVEVDTFIGIFAVGDASDDNYNGGYCMGGTIYCKVTKSEGQNTQIQPACAVMALSSADLLVLYTKVEV